MNGFVDGRRALHELAVMIAALRGKAAGRAQGQSDKGKQDHAHSGIPVIVQVFLARLVIKSESGGC